MKAFTLVARARALWLAGASRLAGPAIGTVAGLGVAAAIMLTPPLAEAKASYESPYGYERTWNSALRYIRVDQGYKVTEKDEANGYLLFDYKSAEGGGKTTPGSLEVVRGKESDSPVTVVVQLPKMPRYHEQVLADGLASKMRAEYGDPPPRKKKHDEPPPSDPAVDAGTD